MGGWLGFFIIGICFYGAVLLRLGWKKKLTKPYKVVTIVFSVVFLGGILATFIIDVSYASRPPVYGDVWHLNQMNRDELALKYSSGDSQTIAFLDTGLSAEYQRNYQPKIVAPYNCFDDSANVLDENGHGTKMIRLACGEGGNDIYGVAMYAKIMPIKVADAEGSVSYEALLKGINYAIDNKATVICLSLGGYRYDADIEEVINRAIDQGITVVAAAGDYGQKDLLFPASLPQVISIVAIDENGDIWKHSNTSDQSVLKFPGVNIKVAEGKFENGTSHACALASGYIALIRDFYQQKGKEFNNDGLINVLKSLNTRTEEHIDYLSVFR